MSSSRKGIDNVARRRVVWPSSEVLRLEYNSGLSCRQLAIKYSVTKAAVSNWLKAYGIPLRTKSEAICKTFELFPEKLEYHQSPEYKAILSAGVLKAIENDPTLNKRRGEISKALCTPERREAARKFKTGTTLSPEGRKKVSIARKKFLSDDANRESMRSTWRDPIKRAGMITKILKSLNHRPNNPEQKVIDIITKFNLPYKYTGDGSFIVAGLNPDFININGKKTVVECFGNYWHGKGAKRVSATEKGRRAIFAEYGWDLIILWEKDINSMSEEELASLLKV
jgi:G:T-mismatch repair DNA endonuclease (very short patch repair protein)